MTRLHGPREAFLVVLLCAIGSALRLLLARQSLFADELSTYWIITTHSVPALGLPSVRGLGGIVSLVHTDAEITPPLYFCLAWVTTQLGHAPELVRAPSLVAGVATIPLTYLLGQRTIGRRPALVAAALTTLSPFMIYYSAEARAYSVLMFLVALSTLAMLLAIDTRRARWWVLYAVASSAAVYTHYTSVFALAGQLGWLLWAHREARRGAILANLGAAALFAPWTTGFINDLNSPTTKIYDLLSPFTVHDVRVSLEHWALGYPYSWAARLSALPGATALALIVAALLLGGVGHAISLRQSPRGKLAGRLDRRLVLVLALALSVPVGEAIVSTFSTHLFGVRNLAASWPGFVLGLAALLTAPGPRLRAVAAALGIAAFALGAARTVADRQYQRPDYIAAARLIDRQAGPRDVVIDTTGALSPGPLTGLDVALKRPHRLFRADAPQERDHPFSFVDRIVAPSQAVNSALAAANGGRVFVVQAHFARRIVVLGGKTEAANIKLPVRYELVQRRYFPGIIGTQLDVYAPR
ncbi:MAG: glycosyltransferase family 39 protein [Solirubrobacteraceae bacterium]